MFCPNCGTKTPDDARFCADCGTEFEPYKFETTPEAAPAPQPVQQPIAQPALQPVQQPIAQPAPAIPVAPSVQQPLAPVVAIPAQKTNVMCIVAFICGLVTVGTFGTIALPTLIVSIIGLNSCKKNNEKGKALAVAGLIISSVFMAGWVVGIIIKLVEMGIS